MLRALRQPSFMGQGPDRRKAPHRLSSTRLLAVERATPTQLRSDTFCRELVATPAGEADTPDALRRPFTNPPGYENHARFPGRDPIETRASLLSRSSPSQKTLLSRGLSGTRAASHPPPRRDERYAAPKVPSVVGKPELGGRAPGKPCVILRPPVRPRSPATDATGWFGHFSTGCSQPVNRRPAPLQSPDSIFSRT
jgi:hypothetical protein